eukprot:CAMPEP_0119120066 /NCGR_PEP_ID=MMETSP1310-20130426/1278_1 /TAXON_ID=464262 /ORGANISM="Genus nov. species nov., Strain RCC2339" /LENGTH=316 /DNA_ID=CAMNT_0007109529 /DNA_START=13 /DNA_END=960 /DNA_ORIENTATION=+
MTLRLSVLGVAHAVVGDAELRVPLGKAGGADDLHHAILPTPLLEPQPCGRGVRHDVAADGFHPGPSEHAGPVEVGLHHLVRHHDGHPELVRQALQLPQVPPQVHLALGEFAAPFVLRPVQGGRAVHDDEGEAVRSHHGGRVDEQLVLVLGVVDPGVRHVVQDLLRVQPVGVGDLHQPLGPEVPFCVNVHAFALASALRRLLLARDGQGVAELGLPATELAVDLGDAPRLHAALQDVVHLLAARADEDPMHVLLVDRRGRGEAHGDELVRLLLELLDLDLAHPFDGHQVLDGPLRQRVHRVNPFGLQLAHIRGAHPA